MWTQESVNYTRTFEFPCNRLWELPQERSLWKLAWILKAELLTSNANSSTSTLSENYVFNTWDPVQARETPYMSLLEAVGATKDLSQKERLQMTPCWEERMQTKNFWDTHKAPCEALAADISNREDFSSRMEDCYFTWILEAWVLSHIVWIHEVIK